MQRITEFWDSKKRPSAGYKLALGQGSLSTLHIGDTSPPVSPVVSLFSHKRHSKVSSSVSSLSSLPSMGNPMEGSFSSKLPLGDVREEPLERQRPEIEDDYFQHFDQATPQGHLDEAYSSVRELDAYDLVDVPHSPKKRRSEDLPSTKGCSRSWITSWKSRNQSASVLADTPIEDPRSRANSSSSRVNVSLVESQLSQRLGKALSDSPSSTSSTLFVDTTKANLAPEEDLIPQKPTTPLLPPVLSTHSTHATNSPVQSPLQSPSVADVTDELDLNSFVHQSPFVDTSPALSTKPSISSLGRHRANTSTKISVEVPFPFALLERPDPWADRLGHANFTILPEPYMPSTFDSETVQQFHIDWNTARCNYAKQLVRTGEHYGVTSKIYHLTQKKWDAIEAAWIRNHESLMANLNVDAATSLDLSHSFPRPIDAVRIPRLHDNDKFPELGDAEIVGPMSVAPAICYPSRKSSPRKRTFLRFFQDLVSKSHTSKVDATRA